jgi:hypothetical protein
MHPNSSDFSLDGERIHEAIRKIETDLTLTPSVHEYDPDASEILDRALSSSTCSEIAQLYRLLLKGDTWAEVVERFYPSNQRMDA